MSLSLVRSDLSLQSISFREAIDFKETTIWHNLSEVTLDMAINVFLTRLENFNTRRTYEARFNHLTSLRIINPLMTLDKLALCNVNQMLDNIVKCPLIESSASKQLHAAAFISLTKFLSRLTEGVIKKAQPDRFGDCKTFFKIRDKVTTPAIETKNEWDRFLQELSKNACAGLIGKLMLQGGRRISEVCELQIGDINFDKCEIKYKLKKKKKTESYSTVYMRKEILDELKCYLGNRASGYVFITKKGNPICYPWIAKKFKQASQKAEMKFKVRPHVMRTTMITYYKKMNCSDSDIIKITGHDSIDAMRRYDKTDPSNNLSRNFSLV